MFYVVHIGGYIWKNGPVCWQKMVRFYRLVERSEDLCEDAHKGHTSSRYGGQTHKGISGAFGGWYFRAWTRDVFHLTDDCAVIFANRLGRVVPDGELSAAMRRCAGAVSYNGIFAMEW